MDKLESSLSPRAATLLWLTEAHQFGSLPAYVDWLIDQPHSAAPMERVPKAAEAGAMAATKGQPPQVMHEAARKAVRDAIFLVDLVAEINNATHEATRLEGVRYAAMVWEMRAESFERQLTAIEPDAGETNHAERWADYLARAKAWLIELYAVEDARILLEGRYFDGHAVLFPEQAADWTSLREGAESLVSIAHRIPVEEPSSRRGRTRRTRPRGLDLTALRASAAEQASSAAARVVDRAQTLALDALGDPEGAMEIAKRQIRSG
jgi:hypothetical protein